MRSNWLFTTACAVVAGFSVPVQAQTVQTVVNGNTLVTFNASSPGTILSSVTITGLDPLTRIGGIDYRPATPRVLYAISNTGQLYTINTRSGAATKVGTPPIPTIGGIGFDFNPTVDRLRIVTQTRQNFRANPDNGALTATDGMLAYAGTDPLANAIVNVAGAAYTNNVAGATSTTLYVIDTRGGLAPAQLATQGNATVSPNTGTLFSVGSTGVSTIGNVGFDIGRTGTALATFTNPTTRVTSLYSVNLTTGASTLIGVLSGNTTYEGLAIALEAFATMGATANQNAVGAQLDQFTSNSGDTFALINGIDNVFATPGAQAAALSSLSPAAFSLLPEIALNAVEVTETSVLKYARDLRGRGDMPDGSVATLDSEGRIGAWLLGGARFGEFDAAVDRPEVRTGEVHVLGGVDYRFAPAAALGVFAGYSDTDARLAPGSQQSDITSRFAGAYGTASLGPVYLDVWGSYTDLEFDLTRSLRFGGFDSTPTGETDGEIWAAGASTGLSFDFAGLEVEPFAAIRYADIRIDGFTEAGSVAALTVGNLDRESLRSNVGLRIGYDMEMGGVSVRPQLRGGWYHEFMDDEQVLFANFTSPTLGTAEFPFTVTPLDRDYYNAGASLDISGNGPLSMVVDYQAQFDKDREFHSMTIGARLAF